MVLNWFTRKKSKEAIELECKEFREKERDKIWEQLRFENPPYKNIIFDSLANYAGDNKRRYSFDKSCERLINEGKRQPLSNEVFSLIIDGLEGKLSAELLVIKEDFFKSYGEWLDLAIKPENKMLNCYEHPRNVILIPGDYDCSKMTFTRLKQFPLNGMPLGTYIPIKDIAKKSPQIVTYFWSRPFEKLPIELQNYARLLIPEKTRPVGRDNFDGFNVNGNFNYRASRGLVEQKNGS